MFNYNIVMKEQRGSKEKSRTKQKKGKKNEEKEDGFGDELCQKIEDYRIYIDKLIGYGTYGRVYKAKKNDSDQLFACKVILKNKLENLKAYREAEGAELERRFKTESEFHKKLSGCANIVKLVDTIENNKAYYFIMEYCESDLSKVIKQNGTLSEQTALRYFTQILQGYKSIYSNNAFHRDLKPENLLIKDDSVKISDFGFVKIFSDLEREKWCQSGTNKMRTQSKVGSVKYMAPDVLQLISENSTASTYNAQKSDVWSMGIILYKMLYGKQPFSGKTQEQTIKNIMQKQLVFPDTAKISPQIIKNTNVSSEVKRLLKKMIERNEEERISFKKLYSKVQDLNSSKEQEKNEKKEKGIKQEIEGKDSREGEAKNKREELLIIYNKILVQLYHDSVNFASLQEIGIENYYEITCKLMTLIHEKRVNYLQSEASESDQEVSDAIKQDISSYHNSFFESIKGIANLKEEDTLQKILLQVYTKIKDYSQFQLLMKEVIIFLVNLLLLLSLELNIVKPNFVYIESMHLEKKKKDVILKYWQETMKNIRKKISGTEGEEEAQPKKEKKHKKHHSRDKQGNENEKQKDNSKEEKTKTSKKSRQKSHDRHKSKEKKEKK